MKTDFLEGEPEMTPNQIRELMDALNEVAADHKWRHKIIVLPAGSKVIKRDEH